MVQCSGGLDDSFRALSDPTRRGILERLGAREASVSELAEHFGMTLTGMKKHIGVLEEAGLVSTEKVGRVRICRIGPRRLQDETAWIARYQEMLEARLDRLGAFLERTASGPVPFGGGGAQGARNERPSTGGAGRHLEGPRAAGAQRRQFDTEGEPEP
ncbi:ArsR/SmtB family transcription factor [Pseudonocardia sp. DLS-67]